ncbi:ACT domain-containing protein, partial [Streptomyces galilaeus]|uniref:ACT domain-containing protein n=1 Tax=Streptomyces galilaeus TaxID=33899 RepID=UPI0038F7BBED
AESAQYAVDVVVEGHDRTGLLRDVCDVLAQGKIHVLSLHSQVARERINITLTVQTADTARLGAMLAKVSQINGVLRARRE